MRKIIFAVVLLLLFTIVGACGTGYNTQGNLQIQEWVRASHILIKPADADTNVDDQPNAKNEAKAAALVKAEDLLEQIKNGADFEALAKEHSSCASAAKRGDLGFFPRGRMVASFEKAAFDLKVGQVSGIVETNFGYHIIKVTDRKHIVIRPQNMYYKPSFAYDNPIYFKPELPSLYTPPKLHIPPAPEVGYLLPPSVDIPNQNISRESWYIPFRSEFTQPMDLPHIEVMSAPKYIPPIDIEPIQIPHVDFSRIEPLPAPTYIPPIRIEPIRIPHVGRY